MTRSCRGRPLNSVSTSTGIWFASQSWTSCGVYWKVHRSFPVSTSSAMTDDVPWLSPIRESPFQSGPGFPVPQYRSLSSASYEPVSHVAPPPCTQLSPDQVSLPGSPGDGMVQYRHNCLPVLASYASRKPRMPASPPLM